MLFRSWRFTVVGAGFFLFLACAVVELLGLGTVEVVERTGFGGTTGRTGLGGLLVGAVVLGFRGGGQRSGSRASVTGGFWAGAAEEWFCSSGNAWRICTHFVP